ncbi:UNVERIFIED_CONTAM: penicillin acylase, partial [Bacteroidetes bacterium 56_B9]
QPYYHFYVVEPSFDALELEYDPEQERRPLRRTSMQDITNFNGCYPNKVQPKQRNGIYGHGKERYDAIMEVLAMRDPDGDIPADTAWKALQAAAQDPSPKDVTSNTQWSLVYDDTDL